MPDDHKHKQQLEDVLRNLQQVAGQVNDKVQQYAERIKVIEVHEMLAGARRTNAVTNGPCIPSTAELRFGHVMQPSPLRTMAGEGRRLTRRHDAHGSL